MGFSVTRGLSKQQKVPSCGAGYAMNPVRHTVIVLPGVCILTTLVAGHFWYS